MKRIWLLILLFFFSRAFSHPHEWLSITLNPILNDQKQITALEQYWEFDPLFAQVVLESVLKAKTEEDAKAQMKAIEKEITHNLSEAQFFTYSSTKFLPVKQATLSVINGALTYQFQLPLQTPTHKLNFSLYEPSYYIEVRYDDDKQPSHWTNGCTLEIKESEPDSKVVEAAAAIDINGKGDPELGKYFAQQSFLNCPAIHDVKK